MTPCAITNTMYYHKTELCENSAYPVNSFNTIKRLDTVIPNTTLKMGGQLFKVRGFEKIIFWWQKQQIPKSIEDLPKYICHKHPLTINYLLPQHAQYITKH